MNNIQLKIADYLLADSYKRRGFIYTIPDTSYITKLIGVERNDELYNKDINYVSNVFLKEEIFKENLEFDGSFYRKRKFILDLKGIELQQKFDSYSAYYKSEQKKIKRAEKRETIGYRIKVIGFYISTALLILSFALNIYQAFNKK
ncbi:hypothetical protein EV201_1267 [Ancylomarina subtilis]|uniref:Uncharacterized protein n=1 Tax=Ancylomarina subtilis TaxID=1639035 RepID=A0A4Q7VK65_9BACT|nr:hypothetical protein [Ancylomarina subtilis]RZT96626.1 hypothetical protein EV201_1267 [Ancylomarina subtilis]